MARDFGQVQAEERVDLAVTRVLRAQETLERANENLASAAAVAKSAGLSEEEIKEIIARRRQSQ